MMKTLKFHPDLAQLIIDGTKTTTWRLFDDKDLQAGDEIKLINKATLQSFGHATITEVVVKPLKALDDADWEGHERFPNEEAMYATYRGYYSGREVGPETSVKILKFAMIKEKARKPYLSVPSTKFKDSFLAAVAEFAKAGEWTAEQVKEVTEDFDAYVTKQKNRALGKDLPEGYVPDSIFWLIDGDNYIGRASVRHRLTESLRRVGGTIGYAIRPSERRKGYGTKILALALEKAAELGISEAIVTCDVTNIGSQKIIEANGGELIESDVAVEGQSVPKQRYRIDL